MEYPTRTQPPPINNHWNVSIHAKPTAFYTMTQPNSNLPSNYTRHLSSLFKYNFITAINQGHFTSWPGISKSLISKHMPQSPFAVKGHLNQEKKNLCSDHSHQDFLDNVHLKQEQRFHNVLYAIIDINSMTDKSYSNQTWRFLVLSSRGNQYISVLYNYDINSIHANFLKNRQALEITTAWKTCQKHLRHHDAAPNLHILDKIDPTQYKHPSTNTTLPSNLSPHTPTAATLQNVQSTHSIIVFVSDYPRTG